jgi:hypothetical protein
MSSFLTLTNKVLRRLNEVNVPESEFLSVRGVQAVAKDSVRDSIAKINQAEFTWPFNAAENQQILVKGVEEYAWPVDFKIADWESFQIQKDTNLNIDFRTLKFISRDQWYRQYRDLDQNSGTDGRDIPYYVFPSHGSGFGVSPSPDEAYTVRFRYYLTNVPLVNATDETRIPDIFDHVIVEGALYYMYMFRDNPEQANVAAIVFQQGLKEMRTVLVNNYNRMYDTRVAY